MTRTARRGFTLIELLVVMGIITTLAALAVLIVPSINSSRRSSDAADRLQGWLLQTKQQALRDQSPRGIRLIGPQSDPTLTEVTELQFIETPENYSPIGSELFVQAGASPVLPKTNPGYVPTPRVVTVRGDIRPFLSEGDYLELKGTNTVYQIAGPKHWPWNNAYPALGPSPNDVFVFNPATGQTTFQVTSEIREAVGSPLRLSSNYTFIRQPRALLGEEPLRLPPGVVIDLLPVRRSDNNQPSTKFVYPPLDILFAPSGQVIAGPGATSGKIVLHVRDTEGNGPSTLITIYARTGQIAAHPVNTDPTIDGGDPYGYTSDGKSSGL